MEAKRFEPIDMDGLDAKAETLEQSEKRYVLSKRVVDNLAPFLSRRANAQPDNAGLHMDGTTIIMSEHSANAGAMTADRPKTMIGRMASLFTGR